MLTSVLAEDAGGMPSLKTIFAVIGAIAQVLKVLGEIAKSIRMAGKVRELENAEQRSDAVGRPDPALNVFDSPNGELSGDKAGREDS